MHPKSSIASWLHRLLMIISAAIILRWLWVWFGPGSEEVRRQSELLRMLPISFNGLLSLGIAIVASGYLCWRFLAWFFWRKYFGDQDPPGDENRWL